MNFDIVTGGCGFIGSHLVERLLEMGKKVIVIDIQPWKYAMHPNLRFSHCDIRETVLQGECDTLYHLAALADIVPSIKKPRNYYETNVTGTFNVLQMHFKKLVYAASSSCYGIPLVYPTSEFCYTDPQYPYALTKLMGEQLVSHWNEVYDKPAASLRLFNVYGPRSRTNGTYGAMFTTFMAQLANNKPLTIVGDGKQCRDFIYVSDVVDALVMFGNNEKTGIFNIGSGNPVSIERIVELLGAQETINLPRRPGEPDTTHADITKIKRETDWAAKISIEDGIKIMLDHINDWKDCPVWDKESIDIATKDWFECLQKYSA